jgi:hypothetical protein
MIYIIDQTIRSKITGLNFIERYGGQAIAVTADFPDENGPNRKTFPVSANLSSAECFEQGKYKNLVPNDAYKSVSYIEELGQQPIETVGAKSGFFRSAARIRVVVWLNYQKLGLSDSKGSDRFTMALIKAVMNQGKQYAISVDNVAGTLKVSDARIVEKNPAVIFGRYTYSNMPHLFFYPYDYFAVDFILDVMIQGNCIDDVTLGSEIDCLTEW